MKAHSKIRVWISFFCCLEVLSFKSLAFQVLQQKNSKQSRFPHLKKYQIWPSYSINKKETILYDATTSSSSSSRSKRRRPPPTIPYITCTSTKEVTRAIQKYLRKGDVVAELGSQLRDSSTAICDTIGPTGKAILLDVKRKFPTQERKKKEKQNTSNGKKSTTAMRREGDEIDFYKDRATFIELKDTFDNWRQELFFHRIQINNNPTDTHNTLEMPFYTALVVDIQAIAGNDLDLTSIALVKDFLALNNNNNNDDDDDDDRNPCRVVIIKSRSLAQLSRRMISGPRLINGLDSLPDNTDDDDATTFIVGTVGVQEYRKTIPFVIQKGDAVLEIGCHFGTSTTLFHQAAKMDDDNNNQGGCIGVDIGPSIIQMANQKYPNVPFVVGDAWHMAALRDMRDSFLTTTTKSRRTYDVVYVDVGGLSGSDGLLEAISLLSSIQFSLEPRCIIIKSLCIRRLASSLTPFSTIWQSMLNNENNIENTEEKKG